MASSETPASTPSIIFRLGLATGGGLFLYVAASLASTVTPASAIPNVPIFVILGALGLFALVSAGLYRPSPHLRWLILAAYMAQVLVQALIWIQATSASDPHVVDSGLYTDFASALVRHGVNPYTWDYGGVFDLHPYQQKSSTPLLNAASESLYPYPALPFLLVAPVQALGLPGIFSLSLLGNLCLLFLIFAATPRLWQPVVLLPTLAGFDYNFLTTSGNLDVLWILALVGMISAWRRPTLRAVLYGLAVSVKQGPALLAPFLLIRVWKEGEHAPSRLARFLSISLATFLLSNGPFILWDPVAWFRGYTEPMLDMQVIFSQGGLSTLTQNGVLYLPKTFFMIASLIAFGVLLLAYWRHHDQMREAMWILPGIVMWLSYRSLFSYWVCWAFPMVMATVSQPAARKEADSPPASWKPTLSIAIGAAILIVVMGAFIAAPSGRIQMKIQLPMLASQGGIDKLVVDVTNLGRHELTPRFSIQSQTTYGNPLPWYVEQGPFVLPAGATATYTLASSRADRTFFGIEPVQLVATDAGGDYSLRGVLTIEPDPAFMWPDMILNADYRAWNEAQHMPAYWQPFNLDSASLGIQDGRQAIRLRAGSASHLPGASYLSTSFLNPGTPLGIWLYPPAGGGSNVYGLEIFDGTNRLWLLYGPDPYNGLPVEGVRLIQRRVPALRWTFQEIDLPAAYAEAGLNLPELSRTYYRGLDTEAQLIRLRLLFIGTQSASGEASFGPIVQENYQLSPKTLMADTLEHPASYYERLGREYEAQGNTRRALEAYQSALGFAPQDAGTLATIERLKQELAGELR